MEAPANVCTPTHLAEAAETIARGASDVLKVEVLAPSLVQPPCLLDKKLPIKLAFRLSSALYGVLLKLLVIPL